MKVWFSNMGDRDDSKVVDLYFGKVRPWTYLLPRIFGERVEGRDNGYRTVGYVWRGSLYVTEFGEIE